jgi:hypothetical protein
MKKFLAEKLWRVYCCFCEMIITEDSVRFEDPPWLPQWPWDDDPLPPPDRPLTHEDALDTLLRPRDRAAGSTSAVGTVFSSQEACVAYAKETVEGRITCSCRNSDEDLSFGWNSDDSDEDPSFGSLDDLYMPLAPPR